MDEFSVHLGDVGTEKIESEGSETSLSSTKTRERVRDESFEIRHAKKGKVRVPRQQKQELIQDLRDTTEKRSKRMKRIANDRTILVDNVLMFRQSVSIRKTSTTKTRSRRETKPVATRPEPRPPSRKNHGGRLGASHVVIVRVSIEESIETLPQTTRATNSKLVTTVVDRRNSERRETRT